MGLLRLARTALHAAATRRKRSSYWRPLEQDFLALNPTCAACGTSRHLQVHHVRPFALFPGLELEPTNLITLCAARCHLLLGHGDSFRCWNPLVRRDAATVLADPSSYARVAANVKAHRLEA